jgi:hypothetical protein
MVYIIYTEFVKKDKGEIADSPMQIGMATMEMSCIKIPTAWIRDLESYHT